MRCYELGKTEGTASVPTNQEAMDQQAKSIETLEAQQTHSLRAIEASNIELQKTVGSQASDRPSIVNQVHPQQDGRLDE